MGVSESLHGVWSSADAVQRAEAVSRDLSAVDKGKLRRGLEVLVKRAMNLSGVDAQGNLIQRDRVDCEKSSDVDLILLFSFALDDADLLLYLPSDMREAGLARIVAATGLPPDVVREAAVLGSAGVEQLLSST